jgi:hypothetical protein
VFAEGDAPAAAPAVDAPKVEKKVKKAPAPLAEMVVTGKIVKEEKQGKKGPIVSFCLTDQEGNKYILPAGGKKDAVKASEFVDKVVTVTGKGIKGAKGSKFVKVEKIEEAAAPVAPAAPVEAAK